MRNPIRLAAMAIASALGLAGCSYRQIPPDPIHYITSPTDVASCRQLGPVGFARTDGQGPYNFDELTTPILTYPQPGDIPVPITHGEIQGRNFALRLERMRDSALALGGTHLLLTRRIYRDWSYVGGTAYRCPR